MTVEIALALELMLTMALAIAMGLEFAGLASGVWIVSKFSMVAFVSNPTTSFPSFFSSPF